MVVRSRIPYATRVILPLVAGAFVYCLRPQAAVVPAIFVGSFPDAAWSFALGSALGLLWSGQRTRSRVAWIAAGATLAIGWELAQLPRWIPGTFDPFDLLGSTFGFAVAVVLTNRNEEQP